MQFSKRLRAKLKENRVGMPWFNELAELMFLQPWECK